MWGNERDRECGCIEADSNKEEKKGEWKWSGGVSHEGCISREHQRQAGSERNRETGLKKRMRLSADLVPSVGSVASQSNESHVTSGEEITAQGSLDFHGSWCGRPVFSGEVSAKGLGETLLGLWTVVSREWRMKQGLFSRDVCMLVCWKGVVSSALSISTLTKHYTRRDVCTWCISFHYFRHVLYGQISTVPVDDFHI